MKIFGFTITRNKHTLDVLPEDTAAVIEAVMEVEPEAEAEADFTALNALIAAQLDPVLKLVDENRKALEAVRRKVYRDDEGLPGSNGGESPPPEPSITSFRPGDSVPPGYFGQ